MKSSRLALLAGGVLLVAGLIVYLNKQGATSTPGSVAGLKPSEKTEGPARTVEPVEESAPTLPQNREEPAQASEIVVAPNDATTGKATNAVPPSSPVAQAVGTLVSPQATFQQKEIVWKQLRESGQLDQAIDALKQGATENPTSAYYPAALGQAQLQKAGVIAQQGAAINELGILGMQADQSFDQALKIDPANWEAQFFKAAAMSHWPLELNKGDEVIRRLSSLIDQQDAAAPEPQFAATYLLLGDQYQKMGQPDFAAATWQIGARKFPTHPELQQKAKGN